MSTREANGLVGAVVRGEEAEGASQRAPPHLLDLGFGIADFGLEERHIKRQIEKAAEIKRDYFREKGE